METLNSLELNHAIPWFITKNKEVRVENLAFVNFLSYLGFRRAVINGSKEYVCLEDNVITVVDTSQIIGYAVEWLNKNFNQINIDNITINAVKNAWINKSKILLDSHTLNYLPLIDFSVKMDPENKSFFYFNNTAIKVTTKEITSIDYNELHWLVIDDQIVDREVNLTSKSLSKINIPFREFIHNVCNKNHERINALESVVGFMLHRFQNPAKAKCIILLDETINELNLVNGGVGKSLFVKGLSYVRNLCEISGKDFDGRSGFSFQRVNSNTCIVAINDIKENQNFEQFYGKISDGFSVNRKYKEEVFIPFENSPKLIITSNYILRAPVGNSTDRRRYEFEFSTHYGKHLTVFDEFGHFFFKDWDKNQWNDFFCYMFSCVQQYLQNGLIEAPQINLNERRLINEVGIELLEFLDEEFINNKKIHKKELHQKFKKGDYVSPKYLPNQRSFTNKVKKYFQYKGIEFNEVPSNTKTYFEIIDESSQTTLSTINDVKTDYKTVDTTNKMTRLVKVLTSHFESEPNKILALDIETTGLDCFTDDIYCLALTFKKGSGYNVLFPKNKRRRDAFIKPLLPFLSSTEITKVFHNAKFDLKFLQRDKIEIGGQIVDTLILDCLLDPNRNKHGLKEISELHLKYKQISYKEMTDDKPISEVLLDTLTKYACEDTDLTFQLYEFLRDKLNIQ